MYKGLLISSGFHIFIVLISILTLPFIAKKPLDIPPLVSVELIQISDATNIPFAPKAKKIIEKIKEKNKKLLSEQAPPKKIKKEQNKKVKLLSGGERNRLHLAMTLKEEGNVLLLDEPTNDLDVNTLRALEEGLENFAGCAVVISHDRWFLDRICTHILAFEGNSEVYFFEGSFSEYEVNKRNRLGGDLIPKRIKYKKLIR